MRNLSKFIILLTSLLLSTEAISLSCAGITEEFIFSCKGSVCTPEFQVSFKKSGGACARRPTILKINEDVGSYLHSEILHSSTPEDGIYKLAIYFRYWRYEPTEDIERLKSTLLKEYGYKLLDQETGKKPTKLNEGSLLSSSLNGISFEFIDSFENTTVKKLQAEKKSNQRTGLAKYFIYLLLYWGSFLLCFSGLVYSLNRFYKQLNTASIIDKKSVVIQIVVLVISSISLVLMSWNPWVGTLLLPIVVFILIAEIWAIFRKKHEKA